MLHSVLDPSGVFGLIAFWRNYGMQTLSFPNEIVSGLSKITPFETRWSRIRRVHQFCAWTACRAVYRPGGAGTNHGPPGSNQAQYKGNVRTTHTANRDVCLRAANHASLCAADNRGLSSDSTNPRLLRLSQQRKLPYKGSFLCSFISIEVFGEDGRLCLGCPS